MKSLHIFPSSRADSLAPKCSSQALTSTIPHSLRRNHSQCDKGSTFSTILHPTGSLFLFENGKLHILAIDLTLCPGREYRHRRMLNKINILKNDQFLAMHFRIDHLLEKLSWQFIHFPCNYPCNLVKHSGSRKSTKHM